MKIAITGAGGLIGSALRTHFTAAGHDLILLSRSSLQKTIPELTGILAGADVIINLAGAPIVKRWTDRYKTILYSSRIETTRKVIGAIAGMNPKPSLFISASAVGIYPDGGPYPEDQTRFDNGFLGTLCTRWEQEAMNASEYCRLVICRIGIVLDSRGGALPKMLPAFKFGVGGRIGDGRQGFSWIHMDDLVAAFGFLIQNNAAEGVFNLCAPQAVSNAEFTTVLAKVLKRPALFPVPAFMLKLIYGEAAIALTSGQFVVPAKIIRQGFEFRFPSLEPALNDLLKPKA